MDDNLADFELELEGLLTDSDNDLDTSRTALNEEKRVDMVIRQVREYYGCNFDEATRKIQKDPDRWCKDAKVSAHRLRKVDPSTSLGRRKLTVDLFRQVANSCPRQQDFLDILKLYHGKEYSREQVIVKCFQYPWPPRVLELFLLRIVNYEMIKIKDKYKGDASKMLKKQVDYYDNLCKNFLPQFFWDGIFKNEKKDQRAHVLNSMHLLLDAERNKPAKQYAKCYDIDREVLLSGHGQVTRNYLINYNNNIGKKGKALVTVGSARGSNSNDNTANSNAGGGKRICKYFNSSKGCNRGRGCSNKHQCYKCGDARHGLYNCYGVCAAVIESGVLARYLKARGLQVGPIVLTPGGNGGGGGNGTKRVIEADEPARKRKKIVQCVRDAAGYFWPIQP